MSSPQNTLVWLASYPKSGNTWLRAFLANYLSDQDGPIDINQMQHISFGDSSRPAFEELNGGALGMMPIDGLLDLRTRHLRRIAGGADVNLVKTHFANTKLLGHWTIPAELTRQAVYLVRNPLDMVISYADHWGMSVDEIADLISKPTNGVPASPKTIQQYLGNWSEHVKGWSGETQFRVLTLRYEDLLSNPEAMFEKVVNHIGLPLDSGALRQAVQFSRFDVLQSQEQANGFVERGQPQVRFFRSGTHGQWREVLTEALVTRISRDHAEVMRKFGYL